MRILIDKLLFFFTITQTFYLPSKLYLYLELLVAENIRFTINVEINICCSNYMSLSFVIS